MVNVSAFFFRQEVIDGLERFIVVSKEVFQVKLNFLFGHLLIFRTAHVQKAAVGETGQYLEGIEFR